VRRSTALATWRAFGIAACASLVATIGVALTMLGADDWRWPRDDWRLDVATVAIARGELIDATVLRDRRKNVLGTELTFAFTPAGDRRHQDRCWSEHDEHVLGTPVDVEYLAEDPTVCRVQGTVRARAAMWWPYWSTAALSALLAIGLWLARAYQTFVVLRHGTAAPVRLVTLRRGRGRAKRRLSVQYAFVDDLGRAATARQHVRVGSELGQLLLAAQPGAELPAACVVHQVGNARRCRLVALTELREASA